MEQLLDLAVMLREEADPGERELVARLAGRLGFLAVHVPMAAGTSLPAEEFERLADAASPAMVVMDDGSVNVGIVRRNDLDQVRSARAELDALEDARPLIVAVPVSIGRTHNEAVARADRDPRFVGESDPRIVGIFGTFEQAQQQVLELARAGAEVLLVTVPHEQDVADVLAQVRALVVGATPALLQEE